MLSKKTKLFPDSIYTDKNNITYKQKYMVLDRVNFPFLF